MINNNNTDGPMIRSNPDGSGNDRDNDLIKLSFDTISTTSINTLSVISDLRHLTQTTNHVKHLEATR